jgi:hypothetical protein
MIQKQRQGFVSRRQQTLWLAGPVLILAATLIVQGCADDGGGDDADTGSGAGADSGGGSDVVTPDAGGDDTTDTGEEPDTSVPDAENDAEDDATAPDTGEDDATAPDTGDDDTTEDVTPPAEICGDDLDNDSDGTVDCDDTDCAADEACAAPPEAWTVYSHPCVGNRTDALHCDDPLTCYVGCGTTTAGGGMFVTTDGGDNWELVETEPADVLQTARVNDISRSDDGLLYVAGIIAGPTRVVSMNADGELAEVWNAGSTTDFSFTAGSFRRNSEGWAIAESLTGVGVVYREGDATEPETSWETGYGFWNDGEDDDVPAGVQILAMEVYDDQFYGVGSRISDPPTVFLPNWTAGSFDFHVVQLDATGLGARIGELWDLDVNADGIVVGGVDQNRDVGLVYTHPLTAGSDPRDPSTWDRFVVSDLGGIYDGAATWVQGVCRGDGVIYAVGRDAREEWGFVLRSTDNGATFEDISPYEDGNPKPYIDAAYRCEATPDGVIIAGAGGLFAVYVAPEE